jgi:hypothetical protein
MNKELCQKCLKEKLNKQNPPNIKSTKEQLQQELKR